MASVRPRRSASNGLNNAQKLGFWQYKSAFRLLKSMDIGQIRAYVLGGCYMASGQPQRRAGIRAYHQKLLICLSRFPQRCQMQFHRRTHRFA